MKSDVPALIETHALAPVADTSRLVERFLDRGARTRSAYKADLDTFAAFVGLDVNDAQAEADAVELLVSRGHGAANALAHDFKAALLARGLAPATVNRRLAALRSVVALARLCGIVPWKSRSKP